MRFRLFVSSLLPLLLLLICSVHVHGQDPFSDENPFGDTHKPQESQPPKAAKAPAESAKLKAFRAQLKSIEETFAQMSFREEALRGALESMELSMEKERLRKEDGTIDDHVKAMFERSKEIEKKLQRSTDINERLKSRVDQLEASEEELRRTSEKAVADHGEMHKSLFESLLFSDEPGHQELAFKHLVKCIESAHAKQISVSLHTPKVHGRIAKLTGSDSAQVRDIASKCLFRLKPDDAMELGIQFGPTWKPLEYSKTGNNTLRINHALEMPFDLIYDEATLEEIVEDLQMGLAIQIRLAPDVPEDQLVTVNSVGRTLFHSLSGMLADNYLGMAVVDEEIVIMKDSSPDLNVVATYNVAGLNSLARVNTDKVMEVLKQEFAEEGVKFSKVADHVFTVKASENWQRKIQERIARFSPPAKW